MAEQGGRTAIAIAVVTASLAGCPPFPEVGAYRCATDDECSPGQRCLAAKCTESCLSSSEDCGIAGDGGQALDAALPLDSALRDSDRPDVDPPEIADVDAGVEAGIPDVDPQWVDEPDPGRPVFPDRIGTISVAVETAQNGTDSPLFLCLTATRSRCLELDDPSVNDFGARSFDVFHMDNAGIPRSEVDRVEIRVEGGDAWVGACLEIAFDGEPVHCSRLPPISLGNDRDAGQTESWRTAGGPSLSCLTCYPQTLTHGPVLGAVTATTARVFVRTNATRQVAVRLTLADNPARSRVAAWLYPRPARDFTGIAGIAGLQPNTRYLVEFDVDGQRMPNQVPITTPAPVGTQGRLRIGVGANAWLNNQPIFSRIAAQAPDLFLFVGDYEYVYSTAIGYLRRNMRFALTIDERDDFIASTPVLGIWDDRDFGGPGSDALSPGKENALRMFMEYWPNPSYGTALVPGVFFKHSVGDVDIFMLDGRYHRGRDNGMLGAPQTQWLLDGLLASAATFKLIVTPSQWTATGSSDSWASFLANRSQIFDFIRDRRIGGVVLLSGDALRSEHRLISRSAAGGYDLPEIVSSPLAWDLYTPCPARDPEVVNCATNGKYFSILDISTATATPSLTARIYDDRATQVASWRILRSTLTR